MAKQIGDDHETKPDSCGAKMDLYNNELGRYLAPDAETMRRWIWDGKNPQREIAESVANAIRDGWAITDLGDSRLPEKCRGKGKKKCQFYIWRSEGDKHVRWSHSVRDGLVFSWDHEPSGGHPGADYNCRCWAEPWNVSFEEDLRDVFKK